MAKQRDILVAELHAAGVTRNSYGLIDRQSVPVLVLGGMVQKVRDDQAARAAGAGACPKHPDQGDGVCPRCAGLWPAA